MSVRHIFLLLCMLCMPWWLMAQTEKGKLFIRNYGFKEYKAHPQNWGVTQDQRGVMYFGNGNGILEYDGVDWRFIELPQAESVFAMAADSSGRIFLGADQEFGYLAPDAAGALQYVSLAQRFREKIPPFITINQVFTTDEGVYFCTDEFLLRWENDDNFKLWYPKNKGYLSAFFCHGRIYVQEENSGIMYLEEDTLVPLPGTEALIREYILEVLPYDDDEILILTPLNGLFIYNFSTKTTRVFATAVDLFLTENEISHGCALSNGQIALGTSTGGIVIMDKKGRLVEIINQESGLQNPTSHFLYHDRQGLLWIALDYGISSIDVQSPVSYWEDPLNIKNIVSAVSRYKDMVYLGAHIGVYFLNNKKLQQIEGSSQKCFGLLHYNGYPESGDEQLLVAASEGIYSVEGERIEEIMDLSTYILSEYPGDPSKILAGAYDGCYVLQFRNKKWTLLGKVKGVDKFVRSMYIDKKGNIWLDQEYDGIRKMVLGEDNVPVKIIRYDSLSGLPHKGEKVLASLNNKLMALTPSGIYTYDETTDRFYADSSFGKEYADGSRGFFNLVPDFNDNIWVYGYRNNEKGIPQSLTLDIGIKQENDTYKFTDIPFKRLPGMIVYDFYPEKDGIVWIGGSEGLYRFDTRVKKNYNMNFNTLIREVSIANDSVVFYGTNYIVNRNENSPPERLPALQQPEALQPALKYTENSVSFSFAAPSFEDEASNRFSYYLEGYDKKWSSWSSKPEKEYTSLPYGDYTFKVKARNVYGVEGTIASYAFSILPPWYATYWAYILYIIAFLFLMYLGIQLFTRRLQVQNTKLEREKAQQQEFSSRLIASQENERKRIAAELHDGVSQSLVLIKNKLYIMLNPKMDRNAIEERIKTLTEDVGQTMDEVRGVSYGLRPFQLDQLGLSKSLEALAADVSQATGIVFETEIDDIDGLFPQDQEINIYRVVQECINNIIKHSGASEATLHIKRRKREAQMLIKDNGRGFDTGKRNAKAKSGFGMMGIRERIRVLDGSLHITSDPGKGTIFSISLPIHNSWIQSGSL